jgi:hypothetical protein
MEVTPALDEKVEHVRLPFFITSLHASFSFLFTVLE